MSTVYFQNTLIRDKVCHRIKSLFALKDFCKDIEYDIRFKGKSYQSYDTLLLDLCSWPIEYRFSLSQPFRKYTKNKLLLTYYVSLIKMK